MEPTLRPGDWLLVWRGARPDRPLAAAGHDGNAARIRIRPGQLVIARHPQQPELLLVKRVAWREQAGWWLDSDNPLVGAVDSARFGPVPAELIEGRMLLRYWPLVRRP